MEQLRVGILSTGNIAATMAETVAQMKEARIYAVASRSLEKADAFAERFQIEKAYGSYEEMAADENVDLVYVASPMSEHYENVKMLIAHGRNVLCEKSFAVNQKQAEEMIRLAREKGVLLAEAMWVRYMPMWNTIRRRGASGRWGICPELCFHGLWQSDRKNGIYCHYDRHWRRRSEQHYPDLSGRKNGDSQQLYAGTF